MPVLKEVMDEWEEVMDEWEEEEDESEERDTAVWSELWAVDLWKCSTLQQVV